MSADDDGPIRDSSLVRPYTATGGRTRASVQLDIATMVTSVRGARFTDGVGELGGEHSEVLLLCRSKPMSVAEVSAHLHLPRSVVKVLVSDLIKTGAVQARSPQLTDAADIEVLEALLAGLKRRL
jgi:hypothetical protein